MLHLLKPSQGSRRTRKRVGRGNSAGGGTTAGRGTKGQHARTGKGRRFGFEGGQTPLLRRQPKMGGFSAPRATVFEVVNIGVLEERLPEGEYTVDDLCARRIVHGKHPVKILGMGVLTRKFTLNVHAASKRAREAIEKAGGHVTFVPYQK